MIPSPKLTRQITATSLDCCLNWDPKQDEPPERRGRQYAFSRISLPEELLTALLFAASENRPIIADSYERLILDRMIKGSDPEALVAFEIALNLPIERHRPGKHIALEETVKFWDTVTLRILDLTSNRLRDLSKTNFRACFDAFRRGITSISELLEWHGIEALFARRDYRIFPNAWSVSIAESVLLTLSSVADLYRATDILGRDVSYLDVSRVLLSVPPPWIRHQIVGRDFLFLRRWDRPESEGRRKSKDDKTKLRISPDTFFVAFALFAVWIETGKEVKGIDWVRRSKDNVLVSMRSALFARFEQTDPKAVETELAACGFNSEQKAFVYRWIQKEITLVDPSG